jgi:hypothetical protein
MITEHLIKFTAKRPSTPQTGLHFQVAFMANQCDKYGYFVGTGNALWRDPADARVVWARWVMTGVDAFKYLWTKDSRLNDDMDPRRDVREGIAREPEVIKLKPAETRYSCKCKVGSTPALDLWCTPSSLYPPLLCSKGGVIPMYRLPLSFGTLVLLEKWNRCATAIARLGLLLDEKRNADIHAFMNSQQEPASTYAKLTRAAQDAVEKETERKVNVFWPPYHLFRL